MARTHTRPTGRPSSYTAAVGEMICRRLASGECLTSICAGADMPSITTVYRWLRAHEDFRVAHARARDDQADTLVADILRIAAEEPDVNRARLMVDARKWVAARLKPRSYSERVEIAGDAEAPLTVRIVDVDRE